MRTISLVIVTAVVAWSAWLATSGEERGAKDAAKPQAAEESGADKAGVSSAANGAPSKDDAVKEIVSGKVVKLADALKARGIKSYVEEIKEQVVLVTEQGELVPIVPDWRGRAFYQDERLRDRPVEIRGKRFQGVPYLQVITFKIEEDGRFQTPEYYCNICTISVRYPQVCPCCQGPMELRMKPERR